jgi:IclR family transcriptional regulator, carbohydrate utilization repressor
MDRLKIVSLSWVRWSGELTKVRQLGQANDNEELELGVRCMACGVFDDQGKLVAGLSISAPSGHLEEGWLPKLKETDQSISETLGYKTHTKGQL